MKDVQRILGSGGKGFAQQRKCPSIHSVLCDRSADWHKRNPTRSQRMGLQKTEQQNLVEMFAAGWDVYEAVECCAGTRAWGVAGSLNQRG